MKSHSVRCKQWLIDNGYAKSMAELSRVDVCDDGNVTVAEEWLTFSTFASWYKANFVEGYQLDKDLKVKGNTLYSPDTCLFIPTEVNVLIQAAPQRDLPAGVTQIKPYGKYKAQIMINRHKTHLGVYPDIPSARDAYIKAKNEQIYLAGVKYPSLAKYLQVHLLT